MTKLITIKNPATALINTLLLLTSVAVGQVASADTLKNSFSSDYKETTKSLTSYPSLFPSSSRPFKIKVRTGNPGKTDKFSFEIPTEGSGYNYKIDCDSDGIQEASRVTGNYVCRYDRRGDYTISISGNFPRIYFLKYDHRNYDPDHDEKDNEKLLTIEQWGDIRWSSMNGAFAHCYNMTSSAVDTPNLTNVTDMSSMFFNATLFNNDIINWNISNITNMNGLFLGAVNFNQDIGNWDVSNVTNMGNMFSSALKFNQDISNWNVSNVTDMNHMFMHSDSFNQDIGNWNVSNVTDMNTMFAFNYIFNQDIGNWDVSSVTNMSSMFQYAYSFNQDIGDWDVGNVTDMNDMFYTARSFNQDIGYWDVSNVIDMKSMFVRAYNFNQDIGYWNVRNVTDMNGMFYNASDFNQDIGNWDVGNVIDMDKMFLRARAFNQNLGSWDVGNVGSMRSMFREAQLSIRNYSNILLGWSRQTLQDGVVLGAGSNQHDFLGGYGKTRIINNHGWQITDGGLVVR